MKLSFRKYLFTAIAAALFAHAGCGFSEDSRGFFDEENIYLTAISPLSSPIDRPVTVVGDAAALRAINGTIEIINQRTGATDSLTAVNFVGSFSIQMDAQLGDTLELLYRLREGTDNLPIVLEDSFESVPRPVCSGCVDADDTISSVPEDIFTTVDLTKLQTDNTIPLFVFNRQTADVVSTTKAAGSESIRARSGDDLCVFAHDNGQSSASYCEKVP